MVKKKIDKAEYGKAILDIMQEGLMVVGSNGVILDLNPAASKMLGYTADELIGESCQILNCTGCKIYKKNHRGKWCSLFRDEIIQAKECSVLNKQGETVYVSKSASVLKDRNEKVIGALEIMTDISETVNQRQELIELKQRFSLDEGFFGLIGKSKRMAKMFELINNVAETTVPVMIHGRSGTGKELVARAIHESGNRSRHPFVKVNCAALNDNLLESELFGHVKGSFTGADQTRIGRFEAADKGTLFLDEIGDISLSTQVKLLRVLEEKEIERVGDNRLIAVDVRIITATNRNLEEMVAQGLFREDLFFRISVFPLFCPSVTDRVEDIPMIVQFFIDQNNRKGGKRIQGVSGPVMKALCEYSWPGNVREIRNAIEYSFVLCPGERIELEHLPPKILKDQRSVQSAAKSNSSLQREREELQVLLREANGNQSEVARQLGVSRVTVWKRMKKHNIGPRDF